MILNRSTVNIVSLFMRQFDVCCKHFYVKLIEHPPLNNPPLTNESPFPASKPPQPLAPMNAPSLPPNPTQLGNRPKENHKPAKQAKKKRTPNKFIDRLPPAADAPLPTPPANPTISEPEPQEENNNQADSKQSPPASTKANFPRAEQNPHGRKTPSQRQRKESNQT